MTHETTVSIILPVHNASQWLSQCISSVNQQTHKGSLELSIYNDASTDDSLEVIESWRRSLQDKGISLVINGHTGDPGGVGFAKNRAVSQSSGEYLCFLDADDVMHEDRIAEQLKAAMAYPQAIIGCQFHRDPPGSTERYTEWANNLTCQQLITQIYTSHGPTVIMPSWFCHRRVFDAVGGFSEAGKGTPEDLIFFYRHIELGGSVKRIDCDLLMYRYHPQAETFSISEETIWQLRVQFLEQQVLNNWAAFSIWNAGKQGRKLFRSLSTHNRHKVSMFCDVDEKKIQKQFYTYEESKTIPKPKIPIVHFTQVRPPVIVCVKMFDSLHHSLSSVVTYNPEKVAPS